jgi:hypothetical protein
MGATFEPAHLFADLVEAEGIRRAAHHRYFENNAPPMRYKWFRSRGLSVGSGLVEAGCKSVIGQRLKSSGMRWTVAGASAITAPALPRGQQPPGNHLPRTAQPDRSLLTSRTR